MNAPNDASLLTPLEKLLRSRERLRTALTARPESPTESPNSAQPGWHASLMAVPGASIIVDALTSWWSQHPLRMAALVGEEAGNALIRPTAQKHPFLLVAGALMFGAALMRLKPWRWGFRKVLLAGLLPQLVSKLVSELPVSSWMTLLSQFAQEKQQPAHVKETESAPGADH